MGVMDPALILLDNMLATGWTNDTDPDRGYAYISVGGRLVICPKGADIRIFELKEIK